MSGTEKSRMATSVHDRLLRIAKARKEEFDIVLQRYALERFLYRLSISPTAPFELARNYRWCAEHLLELSLKQDAVLDLRSSVLYAYRHALELYLKVLGQVDEHTHSLRDCLSAAKRLRGSKMKAPFRGWILELDSIDPGGTSFRYQDGQPQGLGAPYWIDFRQVRFAMGKLLDELDMAILNDSRLLS